MATLREILLTEEKTPVVLRDCRSLLDSEVRAKKGISGAAIKTAYKAVKTFKSGFIDRVLEDLVPEFCDALDAIHGDFVESDKASFGPYMRSRERDVCEALLSITDGKAERSKNKMIKKWYVRLRPRAEANVRQAVPGLSDLMDKHYA